MNIVTKILSPIGASSSSTSSRAPSIVSSGKSSPVASLPEVCALDVFYQDTAAISLHDNSASAARISKKRNPNLTIDTKLPRLLIRLEKMQRAMRKNKRNAVIF